MKSCPHALRAAPPLALLLALHGAACAQTAPPAPMQTVAVNASTLDQRARSTTTAIVVGREEILRNGDTSIAEVLKRQSGITIDGAPGKTAIRMRGLGAGYVAMLLNGLPAPGGFSVDSIDPELVERIEILRAPTAETGGQAVAGAINIVLRKAGRTAAPQFQLKSGATLAAGRLGPSLSVQRSGRSGVLAYALTAGFTRRADTYAGTATEESRAPVLLRSLAWSDRQLEDRLELAPRLDWQPSPRDTLAAQGWLRWKRIDNRKRELEDTLAGQPTAFPYGLHRYRADSPPQGYAELSWNRRLDAGARLSAKLSGYAKRLDADFVYRGMDAAGALRETHQVASGPLERGLSLNGSYRRPLLATHALALGWELGSTRRDEYRRERQYDDGGRPLLASDEDYTATVRRGAVWLQDEWEPAPAWSVYLGLRRENLHTTGAGSAHGSVDVGSGVWSPIFQALFKPGESADGSGATREQLRFALSRTYKAPDIVQLMPRRYTVDNNNTATNPDQQGNPELRPELALGADLAWERYWDKDGMLGVSAYAKRIRDFTLARLTQQDGVWTTMPANGGAALLGGLELEARSRRGKLAWRANLSRTWSRLEALAGPHNRIAGQPAWSGNLGLDYATAPSLDLGGAWTWRGGHASRQNPLLADYAGPKSQLDLYALWKLEAGSQLRLSVADLLHRDYRERSVYMGEKDLKSSWVFRTRTVWRLQWERNL